MAIGFHTGFIVQVGLVGVSWACGLVGVLACPMLPGSSACRPGSRAALKSRPTTHTGVGVLAAVRCAPRAGDGGAAGIQPSPHYRPASSTTAPAKQLGRAAATCEAPALRCPPAFPRRAARLHGTTSATAASSFTSSPVGLVCCDTRRLGWRALACCPRRRLGCPLYRPPDRLRCPLPPACSAAHRA